MITNEHLDQLIIEIKRLNTSLELISQALLNSKQEITQEKQEISITREPENKKEETLEEVVAIPEYNFDVPAIAQKTIETIPEKVGTTSTKDFFEIPTEKETIPEITKEEAENIVFTHKPQEKIEILENSAKQENNVQEIKLEESVEVPEIKKLKDLFDIRGILPQDLWEDLSVIDVTDILSASREDLMEEFQPSYDALHKYTLHTGIVPLKEESISEYLERTHYDTQ
jgi:hypothetical protein